MCASNASFIHVTVTCRSHLEITSLMVIDPQHPGELDSINVVPTQTFLCIVQSSLTLPKQLKSVFFSFNCKTSLNF